MKQNIDRRNDTQHESYTEHNVWDVTNMLQCNMRERQRQGGERVEGREGRKRRRGEERREGERREVRGTSEM